MNWYSFACLILSGCLSPAEAQLTHDLFEQHEVVTGHARHQTILTGFLLGGPFAEIAAVHIDESRQRRLRIYAYAAGTWEPKFATTLRPGVLFVDVANIGGRDRLITYERDRLNWFDPDSRAERRLLELGTNFNAADEDGIPRVDVTRDLNRDGRDDLVVPDVDGFWISTQASDGSFTDAVMLGPPEPFLQETPLEEQRSYGEMGITARTLPWYLSRVHQLDYDRDGRSDLVFWNEDHFDVHVQNARGTFDPVARRFSTDVQFDADGAYSLVFGYSDESMFSLLTGFRGKTKRRVLHSFRDMNGDRVADLIIQSLEGRSVLKQRRAFGIHFGQPAPDGIVFAPDASTAIRPRGTAGGMQHSGYASQLFEDFDGDGRIDVMFQDVNMGVSKMVRAMAANSITLDLEFHRIDGGSYPDEPDANRKIRPDFDLFGERGPFFPAVLLGDVNGDGRSDLLVGHGWESMDVSLGVPGHDLFARRPLRVEVGMPNDERNVRLADLNGDSKQDLIVFHPSTTEPARVTILVAR